MRAGERWHEPCDAKAQQREEIEAKIRRNGDDVCDSTRGYVLKGHILVVELTYAKSSLALLFPSGCISRATVTRAKAKRSLLLR